MFKTEMCVCTWYVCVFVAVGRGAEYAGYWFPGTFCLPGTFCEKMNSAWRGVKVKDTLFARNFYEKMKSAWKSAEVKDTILAGTFCDKMKSAWKGAEVRYTFLLRSFIKLNLLLSFLVKCCDLRALSHFGEILRFTHISRPKL